MKVGVLTSHSSLNYGANLQVYSTVRYLEKCGHDVFVYDNYSGEESVCRAFMTQHFNLTAPCASDEDYRSETVRLGIETVIVGSDAVLWFMPRQAEGKGSYPNPYWLRWARGLPVRKALLAGSCMGVMFPKLGLRLRKQLKEDLDAFDYLSVRDRWTLYFLKWLGLKKVDLVYDPTSYLPRTFVPTAAELPDNLEAGKYILLSFSKTSNKEEWFEQITEEAHAKGLMTCFVPHPDRLCSAQQVDVCISAPLDPLSWLPILANSAGYVGERFHPVVLSAFFNIPFVSADYYSQPGIRSISGFRSKTRDFCSRIQARGRLEPLDAFTARMNPSRVMALLTTKDNSCEPPGADLFCSAVEKALK